ncbi:MAG TPA: ATP-binding domain-containing protein, partial [Patescibacteria group bacterium]|nr:ATP-binding domain-containing protein [Patescibacteria group bacterium]
FMADVSAPYLERIRSLNQYIRFTVNNFLEVEESRQQLALSIGMDLSRYRREADKFLATLSRHQSDWDLLTAYREVFTSKSHFKPLKNLKGNLEWLMAHSLTILDTGRVERDDLAPLCYLHYLSTGWHHLTKFDHIVVDEAQDLNIMEFSVLKLLSGNGSFTIMGDMSQGIHAYRSIESWNMLKAEVFSTDRSVYREILYSYRSSREIVELCNRVMPTGHSPAVPVYETGHRPTVEKIQPEPAAAAQLLKALERFQQLGHRSMGVITRRETDSRELYRQLTPLLPTAGFDIQLVTDQSTGYRGGISLLPVSLAKGLEFDAVILWDASAEQFQANDFDARLLYVALSRAMHGLHIFYRNHLTPLLSKKRNTSI